MENSPRKSKAFIVTFILVLVVMLIGYYLFTNRNSIFGTQGSTSISKIFSPLLGTSKSKDVKVIDTGKNTDTNDTSKRVGVVLTDEKGNKYVMAEAGENLKKGDVLYIAGFNSSNNPIVKKAIANDKTKSLVFGVAAEDMDMGKLGKVIIEGILEGVTTNKKEGTLWATGNPLYLSDKIAGGMTKNSPKSPSYIVPIGSVLKVDAINGSIRIGNIANNENINKKEVNDLGYLNSQLLGMSSADFIDYWNSIFNNNFNNGFGNGGGYFDQNKKYIPPVISIPNPNGGENYCKNGAKNYPLCTVNSNEQCVNGAVNPPVCTIGLNNKCLNGAVNPPVCTEGSKICSNGAINYPSCTASVENNECLNGATDYPTCKILENGNCADGSTNPPLCTTKGENIPDPEVKGVCPADAELEFTNEEKERLAELTRRFYLLAPTIKTEDDVYASDSEFVEQSNLIEQTEGLIKECYTQKTQKGITESVYGNPWYNSSTRGTYIPGYEDFELILNIW